MGKEAHTMNRLTGIFGRSGVVMIAYGGLIRGLETISKKKTLGVKRLFLEQLSQF